jgi:hypothetical protein
MATKSKKHDIDALVTYLFLKKLMTPVFNMPAYRMKLIDNAGRIIKEPVTSQEKDALTLLDKLILKIKRLMGTRISNLYNFLYMQTLGMNAYNNIIVLGSAAQRAEMKRINKDFKRLQESVDMNSEDVIYTLLLEEIKSNFENEVLHESEE